MTEKGVINPARPDTTADRDVPDPDEDDLDDLDGIHPSPRALIMRSRLKKN